MGYSTYGLSAFFKSIIFIIFAIFQEYIMNFSVFTLSAAEDREYKNNGKIILCYQVYRCHFLRVNDEKVQKYWLHILPKVWFFELYHEIWKATKEERYIFCHYLSFISLIADIKGLKQSNAMPKSEIVVKIFEHVKCNKMHNYLIFFDYGC